MPFDRARVIDILSRIHLFRDIEEEKIGEVADLLDQVELPAGNTIFQQDDGADFFYFIAEGQMRISRYNPMTGQVQQLGFLEKYDYFGHEVLETNWPRQVTAQAVNDVTLLRLSVPNFLTILDLIPALSQRLQFILDSYRLMLNTRFIWHDPEEMIYYISRRHVLLLVKGILAPAIFGIISIPFLFFFISTLPFSPLLIAGLLFDVLFAVAWLVWSYIDWSNDYFIVTNRRVLCLEKVVLLYDSRQESPLAALQSTSTSTSQLGRILGYGDVTIRTYASTILFDAVPLPVLVMGLIQEQQIRAQILGQMTELKEIAARIDDRITKGPKMPPPLRTPKPKEKPSALSQFLATMFHLRYENGGTVVFRTHLIILLARIWLPSLLLLGLLGLFILNATNQFPVLSVSATCILSSFVGFAIFLWWLYQYIDWHNDEYLITPDQVIDVYKKPLGRESRQAAPLGNILSIEYKRLGIIGQIINFGTVFIRVGDQTMTFDDVYKPSDVQRELFDRLARKKADERRKAMEEDNIRMENWIATYNQWEQQHPGQPRQVPPTTPTRGGF